jgi:hypothetical protein
MAECRRVHIHLPCDGETPDGTGASMVLVKGDAGHTPYLSIRTETGHYLSVTGRRDLRMLWNAISRGVLDV